MIESHYLPSPSHLAVPELSSTCRVPRTQSRQWQGKAFGSNPIQPIVSYSMVEPISLSSCRIRDEDGDRGTEVV